MISAVLLAAGLLQLAWGSFSPQPIFVHSNNVGPINAFTRQSGRCGKKIYSFGGERFHQTGRKM